MSVDHRSVYTQETLFLPAHLALSYLLKICNVLEVDYGDIIEYVDKGDEE